MVLMNEISLALEITRTIAQIAVPIVIFIATRRIARAQFLKSAQDAWNEFNKLVIANPENLRISQRHFSFSWTKEDEDSYRKAAIAFVALNALVTVFYGSKYGMLPAEYCDQNMEQILGPFVKDDRIYELTQTRGYPLEFRKACAKIRSDMITRTAN